MVVGLTRTPVLLSSQIDFGVDNNEEVSVMLSKNVHIGAAASSFMYSCTLGPAWDLSGNGSVHLFLDCNGFSSAFQWVVIVTLSNTISPILAQYLRNTRKNEENLGTLPLRHTIAPQPPLNGGWQHHIKRRLL